MQIIPCDEHIIEKLSNVLGLIYEIFDEREVAVFAILNENKELGFVARVNEQCLYIRNTTDYTLFALNQEEELDRLGIGEYIVYCDPLYFTDNDDKQYKVQIQRFNTTDLDGFNGLIYFAQYNPIIDVFCKVTYQQMYFEENGKAPIYEKRTKEIDGVYIDENYTKEKEYINGLPLPRSAKYYTKIACYPNEKGYKWLKIREDGFAEYLFNNHNIQTERERMVRYVKSSYRRLDGSFGDLWPFAHQLKREEIEKIIKDYGFKTEIPSLFLNVYNGYDETVKRIQEIVREMKRVSPLLDKANGADLCLTLKLCKE